MLCILLLGVGGRVLYERHLSRIENLSLAQNSEKNAEVFAVKYYRGRRQAKKWPALVARNLIEGDLAVINWRTVRDGEKFYLGKVICSNCAAGESAQGMPRMLARSLKQDHQYRGVPKYHFAENRVYCVACYQSRLKVNSRLS